MSPKRLMVVSWPGCGGEYFRQSVTRNFDMYDSRSDKHLIRPLPFQTPEQFVEHHSASVLSNPYECGYKGDELEDVWNTLVEGWHVFVVVRDIRDVWASLQLPEVGVKEYASWLRSWYGREGITTIHYEDVAMRFLYVIELVGEVTGLQHKRKVRRPLKNPNTEIGRWKHVLGENRLKWLEQEMLYAPWVHNSLQR